MNKQLIILTGNDRSINFFKQGVLPRLDTYGENNFASLHLESKDLEKEDYLTNSKKSIYFINSDNSTKNIENIFFFIHTDELEIVKEASKELVDEFKGSFSNIKFIYLVTDEDNITSDVLLEIQNLKEDLGVDVSLDDMMTTDKSVQNIDVIQKKLYLLGDLCEISMIQFGESIPEQLSMEIEMGLTEIANQIRNV